MKVHHKIKALGITACLIGATLIWNGNAFGERTTGIVTIAGIIGIDLIRNRARKLRGR
jgi:hypothetical protein